MHHVLRTRFLVLSRLSDSFQKSTQMHSPTDLAIRSSIEAVGPAVAMIPIKVSPQREVLVLRTRIGNIAHEDVDVFPVLLHPLGIQVANCGSREDVVAIVEVVVIVVRVPEVSA